MTKQLQQKEKNVELYIIGTIMTLVGMASLFGAAFWIGYKVAKKDFWQGTVFLAAAAAMFVNFGLITMSAGIYEMCQKNPTNTPIVAAPHTIPHE